MFTAKTNALDMAAKKFPERVEMLESLLNYSTIVYIDFSNVNGLQRRLGWQIDLRKLKDLFDSFGVKETRFYFGTLSGHEGSSRFMSFVYKAGFKVRTKKVKVMELSIDVTSISPQSPDILSNFIDETLLKQFRMEAIKNMNEELRLLNKAGTLSLKKKKCNFDVEIATDMQVDHLMGRANAFCLWSGDSDFADTICMLLGQQKTVSVFGTGRVIASELNELRPKGLKIFDVRKLREFIEK